MRADIKRALLLIRHNIPADAVVTFDYDKQQDDELTLRAGEILVNVNHVSILLYLLTPGLNFFLSTRSFTRTHHR